jgi:hypothetical protein
MNNNALTCHKKCHKRVKKLSQNENDEMRKTDKNT